MSVFDWFRPKKSNSNPTKEARRRPATYDLTDSDVNNNALTYGLYHNSYKDMKLAGGLAYLPIALPVWFMGIPVPTCENEETQNRLKEIVNDVYHLMQSLHIQCHRDGTVWIWPSYNSKEGKLQWEFITDELITDILRDIYTKRITEIMTDERIQIATGRNKYTYVRRQRNFTAEKIIERWVTETEKIDLKNKANRNPVNIIPIPFANNKDVNEVRGHSDYERILSDLKDYHDIDLNLSRQLAKFNIKQVQYTSDITAWKMANGIDSITELKINETDFILNKMDDEKTEYIFPGKAYDAYEAALKRKFRKIVEESGVPEIAWGVKTEGNHASAEEQMGVLVQFVQSKREQITQEYKELFQACVRLLNIAEGLPEDDIQIRWNALDALSEKTKSEVFLNFTRGIGELIKNAGATKEQIHNLWQQMYPELTGEDYEEFRIALSDMAQYKQYQNASYLDTLDFTENDEAGI